MVSTRPGQNNKPAPIVGLGPVYQVQFLKDIEIALLIAGKERIFCYVDIPSLENRLKQLQTGSSISAISAHQIEKVKSCHLFTASKVNNISARPPKVRYMFSRIIYLFLLHMSTK